MQTAIQTSAGVTPSTRHPGTTACALWQRRHVQARPRNVSAAAAAAPGPPWKDGRLPSAQPARTSGPRMRLAEEAGKSYRDVDAELWEVLDICEDYELEEIHAILFGVPAPTNGVSDGVSMALALRPMGLRMLQECWCSMQ